MERESRFESPGKRDDPTGLERKRGEVTWTGAANRLTGGRVRLKIARSRACRLRPSGRQAIGDWSGGGGSGQVPRGVAKRRERSLATGQSPRRVNRAPVLNRTPRSTHLRREERRLNESMHRAITTHRQFGQMTGALVTVWLPPELLRGSDAFERGSRAAAGGSRRTPRVQADLLYASLINALSSGFWAPGARL